jgi:hypothetical protein
MKKTVIVTVEYDIRVNNAEEEAYIKSELKRSPGYRLWGTSGSYERKDVLSIKDKK